MSRTLCKHVGRGAIVVQRPGTLAKSDAKSHGSRLNSGLSALCPAALQLPLQTNHCQVKARSITCSKLPRKHREQRDEPYTVMVVTPPPRKLGVHRMPVNVHCGETLTVEDEFYVVSGVSYRYKLHRGRYDSNHRESTLEVQQTSRYVLNTYLDQLLEKT